MKAVAGLLAIVFSMSASAWAAERLPAPLTDEDFRSYPMAQVRLGRLLFHDRVLSGTYRVSCATCHNHDRASSNGVRLDGRKEEKDDLAVGGEAVYQPFEPSAKHAPALFNLGARQFTRLFGDGRVERLPDGSFRSPAGDVLPEGLTDVLAVQSLFPAIQANELAGTVDSDLTAVAHQGSPAIWEVLAARVRDLPGYWPHFRAAYPDLKSSSDITIVEIANAIGAFVGTEWRSDASPFDRFLRGDDKALTPRQKRGMILFYGQGRCATCHTGALQTDHGFHSTASSAGASEEGNGEVATERFTDRGDVTGNADDRGAFRTPSLRNVTASAPYGITGSYGTLEAFLKDHLKSSDLSSAATVDPGLPYGRERIGDLIAFLAALADRIGVRGRLGKPDEVPSSLALD